MLCLPCYAYVLSSTKSVIRTEKDLLETDRETGEGEGRGAGWRNDPNNVCTCE
jgi:hypothetical protein